MDKNKKTTEDDLEEKDVIIGAEEADDEIEDDDLEEDDSYEEEAEEEEEEEEEEEKEPSKNSKNSKPQKSKPSKPSKPQKEPKKKVKKKQEEYEDEEEYEDDDEYDDDYDNDEGGGKTKIIIIAVVIAAAVAAAGIFMYNKITKDNEAEQQRQEQIEQQAQADEAQKKIQEANEAEAKKNAEENQDVDDEEEEETPTPTEEPVATSTPKPLPTATPTATPFPEDTTDDTYYTPDDNDGVVNVSNDGTTGGISNDTEDVQPEATQAPAGVIFVGDSRFRAMANIATDNSDLWECSSTGDYNWLTGTAFTDTVVKERDADKEKIKKLKDAETGEEAKHWESPLDIDFKELKSINPDVAGWIYMEALPDISYPIAQGDDNEFYLHHTYKKESIFAGSIFVDCKNSKDFSDQNTIVYGHNMKNGSMFGTLKNYKLQETVDKSPYFWIITKKDAYKYKIFSIYTANVDGDTYTLIKGPGKETVEYANNMKAKWNIRL